MMISRHFPVQTNPRTLRFGDTPQPDYEQVIQDALTYRDREINRKQRQKANTKLSRAEKALNKTFKVKGVPIKTATFFQVLVFKAMEKAGSDLSIHNLTKQEVVYKGDSGGLGNLEPGKRLAVGTGIETARCARAALSDAYVQLSSAGLMSQYYGALTEEGVKLAETVGLLNETPNVLLADWLEFNTQLDAKLAANREKSLRRNQNIEEALKVTLSVVAAVISFIPLAGFEGLKFVDRQLFRMPSIKDNKFLDKIYLPGLNGREMARRVCALTEKLRAEEDRFPTKAEFLELFPSFHHKRAKRALSDMELLGYIWDNTSDLMMRTESDGRAFIETLVLTPPSHVSGPQPEDVPLEETISRLRNMLNN